MFKIILAALVSSACAFAQTVALNALETEFRDTMSGATLEGESSRDGRAGVSPDKYTIERVEKTGSDQWTFHVKVNMRGQDVVLPLPLEVKWAGDTPVIMVTDKGYFGMGTYTARVVVYKGHYAGTWSGRNGGGKVWGVVKPKAAAAPAAAALTPGKWVGNATFGDLRVPLTMDVKSDATGVSAAFLNGARSSSGTWNGDLLALDFGGKRLEAKFANGALKGTYGGTPFEISPYCTCSYEGEAGPDLSGKWKLEKGGTQLTLVRRGEDTTATLGPDGVHSGRFDGLMFTLSRFDGAHASVLELQPDDKRKDRMAVTIREPGQPPRQDLAVLVH